MGYDYIERFYGKKFKPGDRVEFLEYGGAVGTVKRTRGDPQYVSVQFDDGRNGMCHPDSLSHLAPKAPE